VLGEVAGADVRGGLDADGGQGGVEKDDTGLLQAGLEPGRRDERVHLLRVSWGRGVGVIWSRGISKAGGSFTMATIDWSQCAAVESVPGKRSGAWVFRGTRDAGRYGV